MHVEAGRVQQLQRKDLQISPLPPPKMCPRRTLQTIKANELQYTTAEQQREHR